MITKNIAFVLTQNLAVKLASRPSVISQGNGTIFLRMHGPLLVSFRAPRYYSYVITKKTHCRAYQSNKKTNKTIVVEVKWFWVKDLTKMFLSEATRKHVLFYLTGLYMY